MDEDLRYIHHLSTKGDFLDHFRTFLLAASSEGRKVLLVVEDAQNQEDEILEQVRLFSNMEENGEKPLFKSGRGKGRQEPFS